MNKHTYLISCGKLTFKWCALETNQQPNNCGRVKVSDLGGLFLNFTLEIDLKSLRKVHTFTTVAVESETCKLLQHVSP